MPNIKNTLKGFSALALIIMIYVSIQLISSGERAKTYKADYAELHSVAYGMFNSDIWTTKISQIVDTKIETFELNTNNREDVKGYVEKIIDTLVLEAERVVRERNHESRGFFDSLVGSTKQMITDSIIDFKDLRKRVPEFTDAVMSEVEKPSNQQRAKKVIRAKIKEFMLNKFKPKTDMTIYNNVLKTYKVSTPEECNTVLNTALQEVSEQMHRDMTILIFLAFFIVILTVLQKGLNSFSLLVLSGTSVILLVTGVMLPMLDIEAKIAQLNFTILDSTIVFNNQILFFQSKSISDLVSLLIDSGKAKMILVGVLLVMFSIIFPTLKLIATYLYYHFNNIIANNPITRFFALRSTKWSMADVMVVSIFMAYLGLDGVVSSELKSLEKQPEPLNIITTNGTQLEVGFFLFLGFVATSFVLSLMVEKSKKYH